MPGSKPALETDLRPVLIFFQTGSPAKRDAGSLPAAHLCYEVHWDTENNRSSSETPGG